MSFAFFVGMAEPMVEMSMQGERRWTASSIRKQYVAKTSEGSSMCKVCGKTYSKSSPAIVHALVQHLEAGCYFLCPQCGTRLGNRDTLREHMNRKHLMKNVSLWDLDPYCHGNVQTFDDML